MWIEVIRCEPRQVRAALIDKLGPASAKYINAGDKVAADWVQVLHNEGNIHYDQDFLEKVFNASKKNVKLRAYLKGLRNTAAARPYYQPAVLRLFANDGDKEAERLLGLARRSSNDLD